MGHDGLRRSFCGLFADRWLGPLDRVAAASADAFAIVVHDPAAVRRASTHFEAGLVIVETVEVEVTGLVLNWVIAPDANQGHTGSPGPQQSDEVIGEQ